MITAKLNVDELKDALADAPKKIRTKAVRSALKEAGKVIQSAARASVPVLSVPTKNRKPGTVKKAISVRPSKFARQDGNEGVFVNVRPIGNSQKRVAKLGKGGARNPNDPFYWRFLEFGTRKMKANPFLRSAAASKGALAIQKFMDSVIPAIEKITSRAKK